jgi:hypothetical protein
VLDVLVNHAYKLDILRNLSPRFQVHIDDSQRLVRVQLNSHSTANLVCSEDLVVQAAIVSPQRTEWAYCLVGPIANLAKRLEALAEELGS